MSYKCPPAVFSPRMRAVIRHMAYFTLFFTFFCPGSLLPVVLLMCATRVVIDSTHFCHGFAGQFALQYGALNFFATRGIMKKPEGGLLRTRELSPGLAHDAAGTGTQTLSLSCAVRQLHLCESWREKEKKKKKREASQL